MKIKEFFILFIVQILNYGLMCINFRAVAQTNYIQACASDFLIASMSFLVIRKISKLENSTWGLAGFVLGSVVGNILGIWFSSKCLN